MESNTLEDIRIMIETFKEDHPHVVITPQMIEDIIEQYKEDLAKEIMKQL